MANERSTPSRKDSKRTEIIAIAAELFFKDGYAGTSMSQIAAAVGGSKTTLYNHFQSKEDLLLAVVQEVLEPKPQDYGPGAEPSDFREWLAWFGRVTMKKMTSHSYVSLQRLAASEALRYPEVGRIFHDAHMLPSLTEFGQSFASAMHAGVLRRADPAVAVRHFIEMCLGWTLRRVIWNIQPAPNDAEIEKAVSEAVSTFMDGYALRQGAENAS
jgi:TetR/AcrR family transcriptional regulator, mexJK operon transcriptional repressor